MVEDYSRAVREGEREVKRKRKKKSPEKTTSPLPGFEPTDSFSFCIISFAFKVLVTFTTLQQVKEVKKLILVTQVQSVKFKNETKVLIEGLTL